MMPSLQLTIETFVLNVLWQLPLLTLAGLVAARMLRPLGPIAQYRLWVGVIAFEVFLPAICTLPPGWVQSLTAFLANSRMQGAGQVTVLTGPAMAVSHLHLPDPLRWLAVVLYLAMTTFFALRLLWRVAQLAHLRRIALPVALTPALQALWDAYETRFHTRAALVSSSRISGPITIGGCSKLLILPEALLGTLPAEELEAIFAHEFAHMRRNDFASNLALQLLTLPIAFHPAFWLTSNRLVESRELVCDRIAAACAGCAPYTRSLLRLAARILAKPSTHSPYAIGVFDAHPLERRLMNLSRTFAPVGRTRRFALMAAIIALTAFTTGSALALRVSLRPVVAQAESSAPHPVRLSGGVAAGNVESKVMPVYPPSAKAARIQGAVLLHAIIGKDGKIDSLSVISGPAELTESAITAVRQWIYKPYLLNGEPTSVETTITVTYSFGE